jgi:hypothetical protein
MMKTIRPMERPSSMFWNVGEDFFLFCVFKPGLMSFMSSSRDCIGDGSVVGDTRWAGTFGVQADFVARTHCSVGIITLEDIQVPG